MCASRRGHDDVVKVLIERKATINTTDRYGSTPMIAAASNGQEYVMRQLLESGASLETQGSDGSITELL